MQKLRHAIIGCGRIAQNHFNACRANDIDVVCCCDLDVLKGRMFAERNNISLFTENYLDLTSSNGVDSVSICTDHGSHVEIANAFSNKKHIVVEKPLALSLEDANKIKFMHSSKVVTIISQHRFDNLVNFVKKILKENALGNVTLVNAVLRCFRDIEYYDKSYWRGTCDLEGGSTVINQAYHIVDIILYLFGLPIEVNSFIDTFKYRDVIETEDTCVAIFRYPNILVSFASTNTAVTDWCTSIEIIGTKGSLIFTIDFPENFIKIDVSENFQERYKDELFRIRENYVMNLKSPVNYYGLSHNLQFSNFKDAVLNGKVIKVGVRQALDTLSVIEEIYRCGKH